MPTSPHKSKYFPSNYLKSSDMADHDLDVKIVGVESRKVGQDDKNESCVVLLAGEKPLVCNSTNWDTIAKLYGDDPELWIGKVFTLWFNPDIEFKGKVTGGIRVRKQAPSVAANGDVKEEDHPF